MIPQAVHKKATLLVVSSQNMSEFSFYTLPKITIRRIKKWERITMVGFALDFFKQKHGFHFQIFLPKVVLNGMTFSGALVIWVICVVFKNEK